MIRKLLFPSIFSLLSIFVFLLKSNGQSNLETIKIPILVHVVYDDNKSKCDEQGANKDQNISKELILAEIADLHKDFLLLNKDTNEVLEQFKPLITNPGIDFYLDTSFNLTGEPGIIRVHNEKNLDWTTASPIIDHQRYLNVYIVNYDHSYTPTNHVWDTPSQDAIFLYFCWVGRKYRLLTHEAGHWLGLLHLWGSGDGKKSKISCKTGDDIDDTPLQQRATNVSCDHCPPTVADQACGTGPSNYNNFMDYSGCRKMFTREQVTRMRDNLFNNRNKMVENSRKIQQ